MPETILDGIEERPPEVREALMIAAIRSLDKRFSTFTKALWTNAAAIVVGVIVYLLTTSLR